jgi:hypothetical protein
LFTCRGAPIVILVVFFLRFADWLRYIPVSPNTVASNIVVVVIMKVKSIAQIEFVRSILRKYFPAGWAS